MPPAISDEETSDAGDVAVAIPSKQLAPDEDSADDNDDVDAPERVSGDAGTKEDDGKEDDGKEDGDEDGDGEEDEEDMDEDEFVVEAILKHIYVDGILKFKVKWEGYDKEADQTWEEEDNLRENATGILEEYYVSVGGRDKIMEESKAAVKGKKRGRPAAAASTPKTNGTKRTKRASHPAESTPPASAPKAWTPPAGSWEDHVASIDACHDEITGKLIVYLTWKNGHKTQHDTKIVYSRCPQKMLLYYEQHVKIVRSTD